MTTMSRWQAAQEYERDYWRGVAEGVSGGSVGNVDFYRWRADRLRDRLAALGLHGVLDGTRSLLEVGSGPVGLLPFLSGRDRVAVDPLSEFYGSDPNFRSLRGSDVRYLSGMGEELPVGERAHDLAIIENCIDHVQEPRAVLTELWRVLRPSGILYLTVNVRGRLGTQVHRVLSNLQLDPGHPHSMTRGGARELVRGAGFDIVACDEGSLLTEWLRDLRSGEARAMAKALLGVSEAVVAIYATKRDPLGVEDGRGDR